MSDAVLITPVLAADFKSIEELHWIINWNVVGGLEWSRTGSLRRFRIMVNYYRGYNPYGQFFAQKIETVGAAVAAPIFGSEIAMAILSHHERADGEGYPNGLKGDQIRLTAGTPAPWKMPASVA